MNHPATPAATRRPLPPAMLDALRAAFGERVSIADAVRAHEDLEARRTTGAIVLLP